MFYVLLKLSYRILQLQLKVLILEQEPYVVFRLEDPMLLQKGIDHGIQPLYELQTLIYLVHAIGSGGLEWRARFLRLLVLHLNHRVEETR